MHILKDILNNRATKSIRWHKTYHFLMYGFFVSYLIVIVFTVKNIRLEGDLFTAIIFFFGALFVIIGTYLQTRILQGVKKQHLKLCQKNEQLLQIENATIYALAYLAEIRDSETGQHIERTSQYVRLLAEELHTQPQYREHLTVRYIEDIVKAAPLHDIGKVGVPDAILKKESKLTPEEFEIMKGHCKYGADILKIAKKKLNFESYLTLAIPLVLSHHEKWDGTGYPEGLTGNAIPLSAQIMALADVYDALRSERCYKKAFDHSKSMDIISKNRGKHFAPDIVDAFIKRQKTFNHISSANAA